jgi:hypothetical protein
LAKTINLYIHIDFRVRLDLYHITYDLNKHFFAFSNHNFLKTQFPNGSFSAIWFKIVFFRYEIAISNSLLISLICVIRAVLFVILNAPKEHINILPLTWRFWHVRTLKTSYYNQKKAQRCFFGQMFHVKIVFLLSGLSLSLPPPAYRPNFTAYHSM